MRGLCAESLTKGETMKLFTEEQERRLLAQGRANAGREESED